MVFQYESIILPSHQWCMSIPMSLHPCQQLLLHIFYSALLVGVYWYLILVLFLISIINNLDAISCVYEPFICLFWWNVYSNLTQVFVFCFFCFFYYKFILVIWILSLFFCLISAAKDLSILLIFSKNQLLVLWIFSVVFLFSINFQFNPIISFHMSALGMWFALLCSMT